MLRLCACVLCVLCVEADAVELDWGSYLGEPRPARLELGGHGCVGLGPVVRDQDWFLGTIPWGTLGSGVMGVEGTCFSQHRAVIL